MCIKRLQTRKVVSDNSIEYSSRIPWKPLNKSTKTILQNILKRNDIKISTKLEAGIETKIITDMKNNFLFSYEDAWGFALYSIYLNNSQKGAKPVLVAEMDWWEHDNIQPNSQQQDIFDIGNAITKKQNELENIKKLNTNKIKTIQALNFCR
ncbi:MAG: hypothetical protein ACLRFI_01985 [Alphaproteobacteria bacterium]